ncbi:MAG TPA: folate-binding protein [Terracidiphilus sp.]|nr:folate-binding protein [Terracidiphilus sp.]
MTETGLAVTPQPTALAVLLESARTPHELVAYRGALTPRVLDAPQGEIAALVQGAAMHDLGWMRRVAVRGDDRFRWLSGMVTNTVNDLHPNTGAWNLVLNAQGRIQGDLTVWRDGEELSPVRRNPVVSTPSKSNRDEASEGDRCSPHFLGTPFAGESALELEIAADQYERLMAHFEHFIIMDDVELVPLGDQPVGEPGSETAVGLTGPLADEVLKRMGLSGFTHSMTGRCVEWNGLDLRIRRGYGVLVPHYEFWLPATGLAKLWPCIRAAGASPVGSASIEKLRIAEGIPAYGVDMVERDLPQETSQMRALHFNKGCYLGQEIVERIRSRGTVHRHLRPLELTGPVPETGKELIDQDGKTAGQITSVAELPFAKGNRVFALGMVRSEAEVSHHSFSYTAGSAAGTASILAEPPTL